MAVRKRSVNVGGHRTSYSVEDVFHNCLTRLAAHDGVSLSALVTRIDAARPRDTNLSSALRLYVLNAALRGRLQDDPS